MCTLQRKESNTKHTKEAKVGMIIAKVDESTEALAELRKKLTPASTSLAGERRLAFEATPGMALDLEDLIRWSAC